MTTNFVAEAWTYLAIDLVMVFGRFGARAFSNGFSNLAVDDYLMVVAVVSTSLEPWPAQDCKSNIESAAVHSRNSNCLLGWRFLVRTGE